MKSDSLPTSARKAHAGALGTARQEGSLDVTLLVGQLLNQGEADIYRKISFAVDRAVMQEVLRHTRGNQGQACELLGISRTTLRAKLRRLGVAIEKTLSPLSDSV
jgi:DNA-binding protein Fis